MDDDAIIFYIVGDPLSVAFSTGYIQYIVRGEDRQEGTVLRVTFVAANNVEPAGGDPLSHPTSFFEGNDPSRWISGARSFREIVYEDLWDGIDLRYRLEDGKLKYELVVAPETDPSRVRIHYDHPRGLSVEAGTGDLIINTGVGIIRDSAPWSYQFVGGRRQTVPSEYSVNERHTLGFDLDKYERSLPLIIDPSLEFSTYLGGYEHEEPKAHALDSSGNIYVAMYGGSKDLPVTSGANWSTSGVIYIVKFNSNCSKILYATHINRGSSVFDIAVDTNGSAYITGRTQSPDYPVTPGAFDTTLNGTWDIIVTKLNHNGTALEYSTYVGGLWGRDICVDSKGAAYVGGAGDDTSPTTPGSFNTTDEGGLALFKLDPSGSKLEYACRFGGRFNELIESITIDSSGCVYATGYTSANDTEFPVTSGSFSTPRPWQYAAEVFVLKMNANGTDLDWSGFITGINKSESSSIGESIELGPAGNIYVGGWTTCPNYPTGNTSFDGTFGGSMDGFVAKIDNNGTRIIYLTYLGSSSRDMVWSLDVDQYGQAHVTGFAVGSDFPTTPGAFNNTSNWRESAFYTVLNQWGSGLVYSTYIGGDGDDSGKSITCDPGGNITICGYTMSTDFPNTTGAYCNTYAFHKDAFILRFVGNATPPTIAPVIAPANASMGSRINFTITIGDDDDGVKNASLEYWYGNGTHYSLGLDMISGDVKSGNYTGNIFAPLGSLDPVYYRIWATDEQGNTNSTGVGKITTFDDDPPEFIRDDTNANANAGEQFTFAVVATDNVNLTAVTVEYWYGTTGEHLNLTLVHYTPGNDWLNDIWIPRNVSETLHYSFRAEDNSSNINTTEVRDIKVWDVGSPFFGDDLTPMSATTGDALTFALNVTDHIHLSDVRVVYWYGDGGTPENLSMEAGVDDLYSLMILVPSDSLDTLHYHFFAEDNSSNINTTEVRDIKVWDDDRPTFVDNLSDTVATTGDPFSFKVQVMDWIRVSTVHVLYSWGVGAPINATMALQLDDVWVHDITIPSDSLEPLHYRFYAEDNSSNIAMTEIKDIVVTDNDAPSIGSDSTWHSGTTGDPFNFTVEVHDNIGIDEVWVHYAHVGGNGTVLNLTPIGHDLWEGTITLEDTLEDLVYDVRVTDTSGNENTPWRRSVGMVDKEPPSVIEDLTDTTATTGEVFHVRVRVWDNIGIDLVSSGSELWTPVDVDGNGNGVYELEILVEEDRTGAYYLLVRVLDTSGNEAVREMITTDVVDNDPPELVEDLTPEKVMKGGTLTFQVVVRENVDAANTSVDVEYRLGEGSLKSFSMERVGVDNELLCSLTVNVPRDEVGPLVYRIIGTDPTGNSITTEEKIISLINPAPVVDDLPTWEVTESTDARYELGLYITDLNDDELTVTCSDDSVTVTGMILKVRHDKVVPDRMVTITVSDGEDETAATLTIHVVNVNDLPVITDVKPSDGTKVKKGKTIVFTVDVTDEDGDTLTINWKDGEEVLGTGSPFEWSKLGKGEHTITVVVDDGTDVVEDTFTVKVTEEEESPGFELAVALATLVLAGLVVRRRR